ncbi:hypothetical protein CBER1_08390 [Cercospora berteroae]|uniref:Uncharacterized protein n=1 Tax=Cercospora berteroae TaxID=357750 RepID=A0A2S6CG67_9PEZI|nr:hypothetical protein CBER1_08390 [Cercospora berteroae]
MTSEIMPELSQRLMHPVQASCRAESAAPDFHGDAWHVPLTVPYESTITPENQTASIPQYGSNVKQSRLGFFQNSLIFHARPKNGSILSATADYARDAAQRSSEETLVSLISDSSRSSEQQAARATSLEYRKSCTTRRRRQLSPSSAYSQSTSAAFENTFGGSVDSARQRRAGHDNQSYANQYIQLVGSESGRYGSENHVRAEDDGVAASLCGVPSPPAPARAMPATESRSPRKRQPRRSTEFKAESGVDLDYHTGSGNVALPPAMSTTDEDAVALLEVRLNQLREENFQAFASGSPMAARDMTQRLQSLTEAAERLRDLKLVTGLAVREFEGRDSHAADLSEMSHLPTVSRPRRGGDRSGKSAVSANADDEVETSKISSAFITQGAATSIARRTRMSKISVPTRVMEKDCSIVPAVTAGASSDIVPLIPKRIPRRLFHSNKAMKLERQSSDTTT